MSTVTFFNRCSDVVRADPEIVSRFGGEVKSYGADHNTRRQGRRFRIPEYRYTKDKVDYLRCVLGGGGLVVAVDVEAVVYPCVLKVAADFMPHLPASCSTSRVPLAPRVKCMLRSAVTKKVGDPFAAVVCWCHAGCGCSRDDWLVGYLVRR